MSAEEFRKDSQAICRFGTGGLHAAEQVPGLEPITFLYATHAGQWEHACAVHSGICHDLCWEARKYPSLRPRTLAGFREGLNIP